jgi:hypothetical protein
MGISDQNRCYTRRRAIWKNMVVVVEYGGNMTNAHINVCFALSQSKAAQLSFPGLADRTSIINTPDHIFLSTFSLRRRTSHRSPTRLQVGKP